MRRKETPEMAETRRWLNRGWAMEREIEALMDLKRETFEAVTSITAAPDGVRVSGTSDPHKIDRYVEIEGKIDELIDRELEVKAEIVDLVGNIPDRRLRTLLVDRYTRFMTFEEIAVQMHYSWRQVIRLHYDALRAAREQIEKTCH